LKSNDVLKLERVCELIVSECDSIAGLAAGVGIGGVIGLALVLFFAWISDRRLTNILAFPLIRERAPDGKPIYVCERK
jgi:hypothetical protein